MKKTFALILLIIGTLFFTGCGVDETWNGVYTNNSNYEILIYTQDEKIASVMIKESGENYILYPVQYDNAFDVEGTILKARSGEKITIEKNGLDITIKHGDEEKGVWTKIEGTYTKQKNASAFNQKQF